MSARFEWDLFSRRSSFSTRAGRFKLPKSPRFTASTLAQAVGVGMAGRQEAWITGLEPRPFAIQRGPSRLLSELTWGVLKVGCRRFVEVSDLCHQKFFLGVWVTVCSRDSPEIWPGRKSSSSPPSPAFIRQSLVDGSGQYLVSRETNLPFFCSFIFDFQSS